MECPCVPVGSPYQFDVRGILQLREDPPHRPFFDAEAVGDGVRGEGVAGAGFASFAVLVEVVEDDGLGDLSVSIRGGSHVHDSMAREVG